MQTNRKLTVAKLCWSLALGLVVLTSCSQPTVSAPTAAVPSPVATVESPLPVAPLVSTEEVPTAPAENSPSSAVAPAAKSALAVLQTLRVAGRGPKTGYSRAQFGQAWADVDRNGCDTRDDILNRDLRSKTFRAGTGGCVVTSGNLADPYTGTTVRYIRGASVVDIDHVVALSNAWQTGARSWTFGKRIAYANDPLVLLAVDSTQNRQKGDGDAATWLPANRRYWCAYAGRQIGVKKKYGLYVTAAEHDGLYQILQTCPNQAAASGGGPTYVSGFTAPAGSSSSSSGSSGSSSKSGSGLDPRFGTCAAAKAAGYGPYVRGRNPEYYWYRDGDKDGIDCE